jgi:hypothetical protein
MLMVNIGSLTTLPRDTGDSKQKGPEWKELKKGSN